MEDPTNCVFKSEPKQILYKQILLDDECDELNELLEQNIANGLTQTNIGTSLVTGNRSYIEFDIRNNKEIHNRLFATLSNYCDLRIDSNARLYSQTFGGIKPHTDANRDGVSTHTLLIYLTDDFDNGKLSIRTKRSDEEKLAHEPNMHHKVFTFAPRKGYGVLFDKSLVHWADEVYTGSKNFLLVSLWCRF